MAKGVFISYRRAGAEHFAGRISAYLAEDPDVGEVFIDVDGIKPGEDFERWIREALAASSICLVVIGDNWLGERPGEQARIMDPADFVHKEVAAALSSNIQVIPLLAENVTMPDQSDLPESLRELTRLNAFTVRHGDFNLNMQTLLDTLFNRAVGAKGSTSKRRLTSELISTTKGFSIAAVLLLGIAIGHHEFTGGRSLNETFGSNVAVWLLIAACLLAGALVPRLIRRLRSPSVE